MDERGLLERIERDRDYLKYNFLINLIYGCCGYPEHILEEAASFGVDTACRYVLVDVYLERQESSTEMARFKRVYGAREMARELLFSQYGGETLILSEDEMVLLLASDSALIEESETLFHSVDELRRLYCETFNDHIRICITDPIVSLNEVTNYFLSITRTMGVGPIGKSEIFYLSEIYGRSPPVTIDGRSYAGELSAAVQDRDLSRLDAFVDRVFSAHNSQEYNEELCVALLVELDKLLHELDTTVNEIVGRNNLIVNEVAHLGTFAALKNWFLDVLRAVNFWLQNMENNRMRFYVDGIKARVAETYAVIKNMEEICRPLYLSVSYANAIFKRETGMTIFDYLVAYRIEKAKELLKDPEIKIYEVVELVGYYNKSYFTTLFKNHTGMSPKDYRNKYIR